MKRIRENASWLLGVAFLVMTLTVFGSIELFFTNSEDLWFGLIDVLKVSGILSAVMLAILCAVGFLLKGKAKTTYGYILFVVAMGLYMQGNYANISYGVLDGNTVDWSQYTKYAVLNTLGWLVFIATAVYAFIRIPGIMKRVQKYVALFVMAVQILTLGMLFIGYDVTENNGRSQISTDHIMEIGSEDNVVIFVLDTFDDPLMDDLMKTDEEYCKELFTDFTRFTDCAAGGATTAAAMPLLISGKYYTDGLSYSEYVDSAFNSDGLYDALKAQDYNISMYTESVYIGEGAKEYIDNYIEESGKPNSYLGIALKYTDFILFKYLPHVFKQYFWLYTAEFDMYKPSTNYVIDDAALYDIMTTDR